MSRSKESQVNDIVTICSVDYKIINKNSTDMPDLLGLCQSNIQEIWINNSNTPETRRNVMLHECLHAISDIYDLELSERQVSVMATALIAFARDNPEKFNSFFEKS